MRTSQTPPTITDEEVKAYYDANPDLYSTTQVAASHILVKDEDVAKKLHAELVDGGFARWGDMPLARIEDAGQHEVLNWVCLAGAMTELKQRPKTVEFVESHLFNSSKCFALFQAA